MINIETGELQYIENEWTNPGYWPTWSLDMKKIIFANGEVLSQMVAMDVDGGNPQPLSIYGSYPTISPQENLIAFVNAPPIADCFTEPCGWGGELNIKRPHLIDPVFVPFYG